MSLVYLMDNPAVLTIYGQNGSIGTLKVNLIPTDQTGTINIGQDIDNEKADEYQNDENLIEDPYDIVGRDVYFKVVIEAARLEQKGWKDFQIKY